MAPQRIVNKSRGESHRLVLVMRFGGGTQNGDHGKGSHGLSNLMGVAEWRARAWLRYKKMWKKAHQITAVLSIWRERKGGAGRWRKKRLQLGVYLAFFVPGGKKCV